MRHGLRGAFAMCLLSKPYAKTRERNCGVNTAQKKNCVTMIIVMSGNDVNVHEWKGGALICEYTHAWWNTSPCCLVVNALEQKRKQMNTTMKTKKQAGDKVNVHAGRACQAAQCSLPNHRDDVVSLRSSADISAKKKHTLVSLLITT